MLFDFGTIFFLHIKKKYLGPFSSAYSILNLSLSNFYLINN